MTPVPLDLPVRPAEAAEVGILIFEQAERKPLTDEVRNRIRARAEVLRLETITPWFGSLERDPVHPSAYYLAIDGEKGEPLLLYLAAAAAPTSSIFYKPLLIGRMRRPNGPEMVINAVPFGPFDRDTVEKFATRLNTAFLPRPQGSRTSIAVESRYPESDLPAAFEAFRAVLKRTGKNLAALLAPADGVAARDFYSAALWSAIRAGWREGYSAGATITTKDAISSAAPFSCFRIEPPGLESRPWINQQPPQLEAKFGPALNLAEQLHEAIRQARSVLKIARSFDFELSLERAGGATSAEELTFCLDWLKARGHAAQLAAPALSGAGELASQLKELAAVARQYQATLSLRDLESAPEALEIAARATAGRVHFKISAEGGDVAARIHLLAERLVG